MKIPRPMTDAELEKFARFYGHGAVPEIIAELLDARKRLATPVRLFYEEFSAIDEALAEAGCYDQGVEPKTRADHIRALYAATKR